MGGPMAGGLPGPVRPAGGPIASWGHYRWRPTIYETYTAGARYTPCAQQF
jgi:hypothetical protein